MSNSRGALKIVLLTMKLWPHVRSRALGRVIKLTLCLVAFAMLISFPIESGHQFVNHLRTIKISQQIKRNMSVGQPEADSALQIAQPAVIPTLTSIPAVIAIDRDCDSEVTETEPVSCFLVRIKLGPTQIDSQPPLIL